MFIHLPVRTLVWMLAKELKGYLCAIALAFLALGTLANIFDWH